MQVAGVVIYPVAVEVNIFHYPAFFVHPDYRNIVIVGNDGGNQFSIYVWWRINKEFAGFHPGFYFLPFVCRNFIGQVLRIKNGACYNGNSYCRQGRAPVEETIEHILKIAKR